MKESISIDPYSNACFSIYLLTHKKKDTINNQIMTIETLDKWRPYLGFNLILA